MKFNCGWIPVWYLPMSSLEMCFPATLLGCLQKRLGRDPWLNTRFARYCCIRLVSPVKKWLYRDHHPTINAFIFLFLILFLFLFIFCSVHFLFLLRFLFLDLFFTFIFIFLFFFYIYFLYIYFFIYIYIFLFLFLLLSLLLSLFKLFLFSPRTGTNEGHETEQQTKKSSHQLLWLSVDEK